MKVFWLEEYDNVYWQERAFIDKSDNKTREDFKDDVSKAIEKLLRKKRFSWENLRNELYKIYTEFEPVEGICYNTASVYNAKTQKKIKDTLFNEYDELEDDEEPIFVPLYTPQEKHEKFKKTYRRFRSWRNLKHRMNFK